MTITLDLEPDVEARLREMAEIEGKDVSALVKESIEERLRKAKKKSPRKRHRELSKEKWLAEFQALIDSHPQVPHPVDDSRESIYD